MSACTTFNNLLEDEKRVVLNELFKDNILTFIYFMEQDIQVHDHNWINFCFKCHIYCPGIDGTLKLCDEHVNVKDCRKYVFCSDCVDNFTRPVVCEVCEKSI